MRIRRHPDGAEPPRRSGAWELDAESRWVVEGPPAEVRCVALALGPRVCEQLSDGVALLRFGNSVGHIQSAGPLGPLVIHSGKWTERDYDGLLEDLSRVAAALPFAPTAATSLPYERTEIDTPDVLYHAFVWLRHALLREHDTELHDAVSGILRRPHRHLAQTAHEVPVDRAGRLGARTLADVACGRWPLAESPLGFTVGQRRVLPVRVDEQRARACVDTAENRFIKAFLDECTSVVQRVRTLLAPHPPECTRLAEILHGWRRAPMWTEVGAMTHFPASSSVLQGRGDYRTVLRHHLMLRLGSRVPLDPAVVQRLLESKDIATLYELWATFAVLDETVAALGPPQEMARVAVDHASATVRWGLVASWGDGTALAYNASYTRHTGFYGRSRSLQLRPDVALWVPDGVNAGLHLFDAKFKLAGTLDADAAFQRSDLHKMHTYRDAIPEARSAWVLYPGSADTAFFDDGRRGLGTLDDGPTQGVGALSLRPAGGRAALAAVIAACCRPAPGTAARSPPE